MNSIKTIKTLFAMASFTLLFSIAHAQVPGYMGKRFAFGIDIATTLWQRGDYQYGQYSDTGAYEQTLDLYRNIYVIIRPTIKLEYAISRKNSIHTFARFFSTKIDASKVDIPYLDDEGLTRYYIYTPKDLVKMSGINLGIKLTHYFGRQISPIGFYNSFGIEYSKMTFSHSETNFSRYNEESKSVDFIAIEPNVGQNLIFTYTIGRQTTLKEKGLINFAFEFGIPVLLTETNFRIRKDEWAETTAKTEAIRHSLVNFIIGYSLPY
jgi:hypothetical protein